MFTRLISLKVTMIFITDSIDLCTNFTIYMTYNSYRFHNKIQYIGMLIHN